VPGAGDARGMLSSPGMAGQGGVAGDGGQGGGLARAGWWGRVPGAGAARGVVGRASRRAGGIARGASDARGMKTRAVGWVAVWPALAAVITARGSWGREDARGRDCARTARGCGGRRVRWLKHRGRGHGFAGGRPPLPLKD
jgi:hypothetical protein